MKQTVTKTDIITSNFRLVDFYKTGTEGDWISSASQELSSRYQKEYYPSVHGIYTVMKVGANYNVYCQTKIGGLRQVYTNTKPFFCILSCESVPDNITSGLTGAPGLLCFYKNGANQIAVIHLSFRDFTVVDDVIVWNNELNVSTNNIIIFDTIVGPCMAIYTGSLYKLNKTGLFFKYCNEAAGTTAKELNVNFNIGEFTDVMNRVSVISYSNGTIGIFYGISGEYEKTQFIATAYTQVNPLSGAVAFTSDRVTIFPQILMYDYYPKICKKGASYNRHSGKIMMLLENTAGQCYIGYSRGYGLTIQIHEMDNGMLTQPYSELIESSGGYLLDEIVCSANNEFYVFGYWQIGNTPSFKKALVNTFNSTVTGAQSQKRKIFIEVNYENIDDSLRRDSKALPVLRSLGNYQSGSKNMRGYNYTSDYFTSVFGTEFEQVKLGAIDVVKGTLGVSILTIPAPGIRKTGRYFYQNSSKITFVNTNNYLNNNNVVISFWVYLEISAVPAVRSIVYKDNGAGVPTYCIFWDEVNRKLIFKVRDSISLKTFEVNAAVVPMQADRFYHVTLVHNVAGNLASCYLYGNLAGSIAISGNLSNAATSLILGDSTIHAGGAQSFKGRLDSLVIGSGAPSHDLILHSFAQEITATTGPVINSRTTVPDKITATWQFRAAALGATTYTIVSREFSFGINTISQHVIFDIYQTTVGKAPTYLKTISSPTGANSIIGSNVGYKPTVTDIYGFYNDDLGVFTMFIVFNLASSNNYFVARARITIAGDVLTTWTLIAIASSATYTISKGLSVYRNSSGDIVIINLYGPNNRVYFIRPQDYGATAIAVCPITNMANLIPISAKTNPSKNYPAIAGDIVYCGMVNREIDGAMGFKTLYKGQLQLVYGLLSKGGGSLFVQANTVIATCHCMINVANLLAGTVVLVENPIGLDQYGMGGVQPFAPLKLLNPPPGIGFSGDCLILGYEGVNQTGSALTYSVDNRLAVYSVNSTLLVEINKLFNVSMDALNISGAFTVADIEYIQTTEGTGTPICNLSVVTSYEVENGYNNIYVGTAEAASLSYNLSSPGTFNPILTDFRVTGPVWHEYKFETTKLVKEGINRKLEMQYYDVEFHIRNTILAPDSSKYTLTPNTTFFTGFYHFCYSKKNFVRAFFGDAELYIGMYSSITSTNQVIMGTNLGNIGTFDTGIYPIGIVELDDIFYYCYITFGPSGFSVIKAYKGSIEGVTGSNVNLWDIPILLPTYCYQDVRIIVHNNEIYCYFILSDNTESKLLYIKLSKTGTVSSSPYSVTTFNFKIMGRFNIVSDEFVTIYVGNNDRSVDLGTYVCVHDPIKNKIIKDTKLLVKNYLPYTRCNNVSDIVHFGVKQNILLLEPLSSINFGGFYNEFVDNFKQDKDTGENFAIAITYNKGYLLQEIVSVNKELLYSIYIDGNYVDQNNADLSVFPVGILKKSDLVYEIVFIKFEPDYGISFYNTRTFLYDGGKLDVHYDERLLRNSNITDPQPGFMGDTGDRSNRMVTAEMVLKRTLILDNGDLPVISSLTEDTRSDIAVLDPENGEKGTLASETAIQPIWNYIHGARGLLIDKDNILGMFVMWENT